MCKTGQNKDVVERYLGQDQFGTRISGTGTVPLVPLKKREKVYRKKKKRKTKIFFTVKLLSNKLTGDPKFLFSLFVF